MFKNFIGLATLGTLIYFVISLEQNDFNAMQNLVIIALILTIIQVITFGGKK